VSFALAAVKAPTVDFAGLSPLIALLGGAVLVLMVALLPAGRAVRAAVPGLAFASLAAALGLTIWQWGERKSVVAGALAVDDLTMFANLLFIASGAATIALSLRERATEEAGAGELHALVLSAVAGMAVLAGAQNTVAVFLGFELLSIPLYILCATELSRAGSLESGLKYLIIGSVGSATLLYGLALLYGATGATDFDAIARALGPGGLAGNAMVLTGIGLVVVGLAFKASVAPFHQWTPDVYQGAPTPITAFMAVATKAAVFALVLRFFDVAVIDAAVEWGAVFAALAAATILVGNVGALGQSSLKRLLAWSSVGQAGYLLAGVVVASQIGAQATAFYLAVYLLMNLAAFAVVVAAERESGRGDDISALEGLSASRPWLAWPMTIAMLSLAGIPATAGFIGKFYLIDAAVQGGFAWLGVAIVVGSMISLGYYLPVVAKMWLTDEPAAAGPGAPRPAMAGGAPESDPRPAGFEVTLVAVVCGAATLVFGILPGPLFELAADAGQALGVL
jgi:NADH-quinone oxidoreductase subunit N